MGAKKTDFVIGANAGITYSTDYVPVDDRFDFWSEYICKEIFNVECYRLTNGKSFSGVLRCSRLSDIGFMEIYSDPQIFHRTKATLENIEQDCMIITIPLYNTTYKMINTKRFTTDKGDISIHDGSKVQQLSVHNVIEALALQVPKHLFSRHIKTSENYDGHVVSAQTATGHLTTKYIKTIAGQLGQFPAKTPQKIVDTLVQLLSIAMSDSLACTPNIHCSEDISGALLAEIKHFINANLCNPKLTPEHIAKQHSISVRYLHKLFKQEPYTVSRYITHCRLEKSYEALGNKEMSNMTITNIALALGFSDVSHFSRAFKSKYNVSAKEFRYS